MSVLTQNSWIGRIAKFSKFSTGVHSSPELAQEDVYLCCLIQSWKILKIRCSGLLNSFANSERSFRTTFRLARTKCTLSNVASDWLKCSSMEYVKLASALQTTGKPQEIPEKKINIYTTMQIYHFSWVAALRRCRHILSRLASFGICWSRFMAEHTSSVQVFTSSRVCSGRDYAWFYTSSKQNGLAWPRPWAILV